MNSRRENATEVHEEADMGCRNKETAGTVRRHRETEKGDK